MKIRHTYIVHPKNKEQASALKAFMEALKIKFEESDGDDKSVIKSHRNEKPRVFKLSETHKKRLDERLQIDKKDFISARGALSGLRKKYEL